MVEKDVYRKFVGNACLYRDLAVREPPPFLRRNLDRALDVHAHLLQQQITGMAFLKGTLEQRRAAIDFHYLESEVSREVKQPRNPALRIDALQLRLLDSKDSAKWRTPRERTGDPESSPSWLPFSDEEFRIPCRVTIKLVDTRNPKRTVFARPEFATVVGQRDENGEPYYDIALHNHYLIELDWLLAIDELDAKAPWHRKLAGNCSLEVSIHCQDSDDTLDLFSRLESRDASQYSPVPANESAVKAFWKDIRTCPEKGQLLPLKRAKGHKAVEMKFGLSLSMFWSKRKETPLVSADRSREERQQLPTPTSSEDLNPKVEVHYEFTAGIQTRTHSRENLSCMFCASEREYSNVPRLLLHYRFCHAHFTFEDPSSRYDAAGKQHVSIVIGLPDASATHQATSDLRNPVRHEWVAPEKPYDIDKHLGGDEGWTGGSGPKVPQKRGRPRKNAGADPARIIDHGDSPSKPQQQLHHPRRNRDNLGEVRDLPEIEQKRHAAPDVHGVKFYHTYSKQPLHKAERTGDDEDGGPDVRLAPSQHRSLEEDGLSAAEVEFYQAFNQHLDTEQSASILMRDALVRFERKYRGQLQGDWQVPFRKKLAHLNSYGVIGEDVVVYSLSEERVTADIAKCDDGDIEMDDAPTQWGANATTPSSGTKGQAAKRKRENPTDQASPSGAKRRRAEVGEDASAQDVKCTMQPPPRTKTTGAATTSLSRPPNYTTAFAKEPKRPAMKGHCMCGELVLGGPGCVACDDLECTRGDFHLACVGMVRPSSGWRCDECLGIVTPPSAIRWSDGSV